MSPYVASDWPEQGKLDGGFCLVCHSHFCPHAMPDLYAEQRPARRRVAPPLMTIPERSMNGADRHHIKVAAGNHKPLYSGKDSALQNERAAIAEQLVADSLGTTYDDSIHVGGDGGVDMVFRNRTVDVYLAEHPGARYGIVKSVNGFNQPRADLYVSVVPDGEGFAIAGWCLHDELLATATDLGYGPRYVRRFSDLHPLTDLFEMPNKEEL